MDGRTTATADVRLLGDLLGEVILRVSGREVFETVERLRVFAVKMRTKRSAGDLGALLGEIEKLSPETQLHVSRAFTLFFYLVGVCEERASELRHREKVRAGGEEPPENTVTEAVAGLSRSGKSADDVQRALLETDVRAIITAHPTQARRSTVMDSLRRVRQLLELDSGYLTRREQQDRKYSLTAEIEGLWLTELVRPRRPSVLDEVEQTVRLFTACVFDALPEVYWELDRALRHYYPGKTFKIPRVCQVGTWPGGDADGNPNVTSDVTWEALLRHRQAALQLHIGRAEHFLHIASAAEALVAVTPELRSYIERWQAKLPAVNHRNSGEPYRRAFGIIGARLQLTLEADPASCASSLFLGYQTAQELWEEIGVIQQSLLAHGGQYLAEKELAKWRRQVDLFGFHLASIDYRQNSALHERAVAEALAVSGVCPNYAQLPEEERFSLLSRLLLDPRPLIPRGAKFSDESARVIAAFETIARAHKLLDPRAIESYIISNTASASDVFEVLLLAKEAGLCMLERGVLRSALNIVPLFETITDFPVAAQVMQTLWESPLYRIYLNRAELKDQQVVMVGFSDGGKSAGYLAANWEIYKLQKQLPELAKGYGLTVTFFHGRGGTTARGGGPQHQAILTQPHPCGRVRSTVQGEVAATALSDPRKATYQLGRVLHAAFLSAAGVTETAAKVQQNPRLRAWEEALAEISSEACRVYRALVESKAFEQYFFAATPITEWARLPLGSRPAKRPSAAKGGLAALRAIPWVAAGKHAHMLVASGFSTGAALKAFVSDSRAQGRLALLQEMQREWPFFRQLIDRLEREMVTTDLEIAELYSQLVGEDSLRMGIWEQLVHEYRDTEVAILSIKREAALLENDPAVRSNRELRGPYVTVVSLSELVALRRLRAATAEEGASLERLFLHAAISMAAGLNETG